MQLSCNFVNVDTEHDLKKFAEVPRLFDYRLSCAKIWRCAVTALADYSFLSSDFYPSCCLSLFILLSNSLLSAYLPNGLYVVLLLLLYFSDPTNLDT